MPAIMTSSRSLKGRAPSAASANELGLFGTSGKVWEWVQDCWSGSYRDAPDDGRLKDARLGERVMTITAENELLQRITARPDIFGGKPVVRDMRIAVEHILGMLAAGDSAQLPLQEYPQHAGA